MRLNDQPAVLLWPEFEVTGRHQKMNPVQRKMEFATVREAAQHWNGLPYGVKANAVILTGDVTLHPADVEAILREAS